MAVEDHSLFSIPVRVVDLENHTQIKEAFAPWISSTHPELRNQKLWECDTKSTFGQANREIPFELLRSSLDSHLQDYISEFFRPQNDARVEEKEIWLNVYSKGDYQEIHNHVGNRTVISMAYMLAQPARSGSFVFYRNGDTFFRGLTDYVRPDFSRDRVAPGLREGQAVFFPSSLPHYVSPHQSDSLRATVSANYWVCHPSLGNE